MTETKTIERDYRLDGNENLKAYEQGLVESDWYTSEVPGEQFRTLLKRKNGPAIRDTLIWFALLGGSGYGMVILWGTWWSIIPIFIYSTIYGSTSDSRWHESVHGTAFKSTWMNNVLYEIASFMVFREATPWRWSHNRHHSDTIIRGRDPEIAVQRPPNIRLLILDFINLVSAPAEFKKILIHAAGKLNPQEVSYLPASEYRKTFWKARLYLLIFGVVVGLSIYYWTLLPLFLIGIPSFIGAWLKIIYGLTQHAGLAENVLDHRLNSRTVYMNRIHRYLYWNMNYHIEHHMFPMVPYHSLKRLHKLIKGDMPKPKSGIIDAYREIIPAIKKQVKDPDYHIKIELPDRKNVPDKEWDVRYTNNLEKRDLNGLLEICPSVDLESDEVIRFDLPGKTFAIYRSSDNQVFATDGICTHGNAHLSKGLVLGDLIECPKHNGRFNFKDGSPKRQPVCRAINTYSVVEKNGTLFLKIADEDLKKLEDQTRKTSLKVISNENVSTYIKELVLEILDNDNFKYNPGEYIKLEIPPIKLEFKDFLIQDQYLKEWETKHLLKYKVLNEHTEYRNYSMATNPGKEKQLRFNVRIAFPPSGIKCQPGIGSAYVFGLRPGDIVKAIGPFGDFHIKETKSEMIYIGGGSGMAPLRSHISYLFDTLATKRKVSFWYGARSKRELFYIDYFRNLADKYENFNFYVSLSEPEPEDNGTLYKGFIHEVFRKEYLSQCPKPQIHEYYLCGPPQLIKAVSEVLQEKKVPQKQIAFDEF